MKIKKTTAKNKNQRAHRALLTHAKNRIRLPDKKKRNND